MIILHAAASCESFNAVRLVGVGTTGMRFVQRFHASTSTTGTPLEQSQDDTPRYIWIDGGERDALFEPADLGSTRLLLLAFGEDVRAVEIEAAMHLIWTMWNRGGHVIGIVIADRQFKPARDSMFGILRDALDARIDLDEISEEMEPLQWFYLGLRRSILDGALLLEPAWDTDDVVETLGLSEVELVLRMETFDSPGQLLEAMDDALRDLNRREPGIERAQGMLIVLWAPREFGLRASDVRDVGRRANEAMGAGALHLIIRLSGSAHGAKGALTLVVSFSRLHLSLSPIPF